MSPCAACRGRQARSPTPLSHCAIGTWTPASRSVGCDDDPSTLDVPGPGFGRVFCAEGHQVVICRKSRPDPPERWGSCCARASVGRSRLSPAMDKVPAWRRDLLTLRAEGPSLAWFRRHAALRKLGKRRAKSHLRVPSHPPSTATAGRDRGTGPLHRRLPGGSAAPAGRRSRLDRRSPAHARLRGR